MDEWVSRPAPKAIIERDGWKVTLVGATVDEVARSCVIVMHGIGEDTTP